MTKPKSALDPFLLALGNAPPGQLLTRQQAAGFLGIGLTTLDEWRSRNLPPPWVDLRGMIRYRCGDLAGFSESLPCSQPHANSAVAGTAGVPVPIPAGEKQRMGMYAPIMRGGRRKKITTFASWLADGDPVEPPWRFAMLPDLGTQYPRRPVDLIATLEFDLSDDAPCVELTMLEYAHAMAEYASAAEKVVECERLDRELPPAQSGRDDSPL